MDHPPSSDQPRNKRQSLYRALKWIGLTVLLMLLLASGFIALLLASPDYRNQFSGSVVKALQSPDAPYELAVEQIDIGWQSWQQPLTVQLGNIQLVSAEHDTQVQIPYGSADLDFWLLLQGKVQFDHLRLDGLQALLIRDETGWMLHTADDQPFYRFTSDGEHRARPDIPFNEITISNAEMMIRDDIKKLEGQLSSTLISAEIDSETDINFSYRTQAILGDIAVPLVGGGQIDADQQKGELLLKIQDFAPDILCGVLIDCDGVPVLSMPLTGSVVLRSGEGRVVDQVLVSLDGGQGTLDAQPYLPEPLAIDAMSFQARLSDSAQQVEVSNLMLQMGDVQVTAHGDATKEEAGFRLTMDAAANQMPVNDLYKYWPVGLSPASREWATTNVREGMAYDAKAQIRIIPEDLESEYLPDAFLDASFRVENTTLNYIKRFPKAQEVNGTVRFSGTTMKAEIDSAKAMTGTNIQTAQVHLTDLNAPGTPVEISLSLDTSPQDAAKFMTLLPNNPLADYRIDASAAAGRLSTDVTLAFNAFSGGTKNDTINWDALRYNVKGHSDKLTAVSVYDRLLLDTVSGSFVVNNGSETVKLKGSGSGEPYQFSLQSKGDHHQSVEFAGRLPEAVLTEISPDIEGRLIGNPKFDVTLGLRSGEIATLNGQVDLKGVTLNIPEVGYIKTPNEPASIRMQAEKITQVDWQYQSADLNAKGLVRRERIGHAPNAVDIHQWVGAGQDLALQYRKLHDGYRVGISGKRLDLSPFLPEDDAEGTSTISDLPSIRLELDLDSIYFPTGKALRNTKGHLHCHSQRCESADLNAVLDNDGALSVKIFREGGARHFHLDSVQTGALLKILDIHDSFYDGKTSIKGTYDDSKPGNPLAGRVIVTNFLVKDAPILGRILNISSLTGLVDSLNGDGIRFDKFAGDFVFANDLLTLKGGKVAGPSLGILIDGEVNIETDILDIGGNLAPAYVINSFIGKIPLIGEALVGGKGESIFAINYSVKGPISNPSVVANPLSAFTPGFTRRFFDIFDTPPDTQATQEQKPTESKPEPALNDWPSDQPDTRVLEVETDELPPPAPLMGE